MNKKERQKIADAKKNKKPKIPSFIVKNREDNQIELIWQGDGEIISFLLSEYEAIELYNNLARAFN